VRHSAPPPVHAQPDESDKLTVCSGTGYYYTISSCKSGCSSGTCYSASKDPTTGQARYQCWCSKTMSLEQEEKGSDVDP
jgi:hypothetical protein